MIVLMRFFSIKNMVLLSNFVLVAVLLLLSSGASTGYTQSIEQIPPISIDVSEDDVAYKVGPNDVLTIMVYDNPDLSGDFIVSAEGGIVYPLLGHVHVLGKSINDIKNMMKELLEKDYLYNPIVSASVKEHRSQKVKVMGNVGKPGIYNLEGPTRLFDILSTAEGISPQLGNVMRGQKVTIVRKINGPTGENGKALPHYVEIESPQLNTVIRGTRQFPTGTAPEQVKASEQSSSKIDILTIDLYELLIEGKEDANILLKDGDVLYVSKSHMIHVIGEVKRPGSFPYEAGMTVLKAISLAGGTTNVASQKNTVVRRIEQGKEVKIKVDMADPVLLDDIIEVPLSFW